jgi:hypothetical protein
MPMCYLEQLESNHVLLEWYKEAINAPYWTWGMYLCACVRVCVYLY